MRIAAMAAAVLLCAPHWCAGAEGYEVLHGFAGPPGDGAVPWDALLLSGGSIHGVTVGGGANDEGTAYTFTPSGSQQTVLHDFGNDPNDGSSPRGGLVADNGTLYGVTELGGTWTFGTIFAIENGTYNIKYEFEGVPKEDGAEPTGPLLLEGGTLYGMTTLGGKDDCGTIFSVSTDFDTPAVLHHFSGPDGQFPRGGLVSDGSKLYGMTGFGGGLPDSYGVLFSIGKDGAGFEVLHRFGETAGEGLAPFGDLVLEEGRLFGTTIAGGGDDMGTVFGINTDGGDFTVLHSFKDDSRGALPMTGLMADRGRLFGTTMGGGAGNYGTVFSLRTDGGAFTVLHEFKGIDDPSDPDGALPSGPLATDGSKVYGTTFEGGTSDSGTLYAFDLPTLPLAIMLNKTVLRAGDRLTVDVEVQPIAQAFDAWAVILGDTSSYSMVLGRPGEVRSGARPLARNVGGLGTIYTGRLLDLAIPQGAAGSYRVIVGLVPEGTTPTGPESCIAGYVDERAVTVK
ncbi:MAG: hypothetical protein PHN82_05560 [bacterium]|nr:hypothetical protein [bacterium]